MDNQFFEQCRIFHNPWPVYTRFINRKQYEITDHSRAEQSRCLGSTRVVVNDRALVTFSEEDGSVTYACADVLSLLNYYPGGQLQPGMTWQNALYRYAYNTQERTDELYGSGNFYTAEFWEYDTRILRRWNRDPVSFADFSVYAVFFNNPIYFIDVLGLNAGDYFKKGKNGKLENIGTDGKPDDLNWVLNDGESVDVVAPDNFELIQHKFSLYPDLSARIEIFKHYQNFNANKIKLEIDGITLRGTFHEEGGFGGYYPDGSRELVKAVPGSIPSIIYLKGQTSVSVDPMKSKDEAKSLSYLLSQGFTVDLIYHFHPSATIYEDPTDFSSIISNKPMLEDLWIQTPSIMDYENVEKYYDRYLRGGGTVLQISTNHKGMVHFLNNNRIMLSIPMNVFVKPLN